MKTKSAKLKAQSYGSKLKTFYLLILLLTFAFLVLSLSNGLLLTLKPTWALTMSNNNFILKTTDLNMISGKSTDTNYKLNFTGGQTAPGLYTGTNYKVKAGFQYLYEKTTATTSATITATSAAFFSFSISQTEIDFGILSPTNPVTRTNKLTVSSGSASGYSVIASENHELSAGSGSLIPDTTCDNGSCTEITSASWASILAYGFGYRCDNITGTDCASGFSSSNFYKQFANNSKEEASIAVQNGTGSQSTRAVQVTYKVNISGTQPAGTYTNAITYIATPTF